MAKRQTVGTVGSMGTCEHTQVPFVKGPNTIYCCPEPHGTIFRRMLTAKGFVRQDQKGGQA